MTCTPLPYHDAHALTDDCMSQPQQPQRRAFSTNPACHPPHTAIVSFLLGGRGAYRCAKADRVIARVRPRTAPPAGRRGVQRAARRSARRCRQCAAPRRRCRRRSGEAKAAAHACVQPRHAAACVSSCLLLPGCRRTACVSCVHHQRRCQLALDAAAAVPQRAMRLHGASRRRERLCGPHRPARSARGHAGMAFTA